MWFMSWDNSLIFRLFLCLSFLKHEYRYYKFIAALVKWHLRASSEPQQTSREIETARALPNYCSAPYLLILSLFHLYKKMLLFKINLVSVYIKRLSTRSSSKSIYFILFYLFFQIHTVTHTQQGRQRKPNIKTLFSYVPLISGGIASCRAEFNSAILLWLMKILNFSFPGVGIE